MTGSIRVAAVQLAAHDHSDFSTARPGIIAATRGAASQADLVVLPEATFPAYVLGGERIDERAVAEALEQLRSIAAQTATVIVAGAAAVTATGIRNGAVVIDADGSFAGRADKLFLWHFDRRWFEPGDRIAPIATALGALGVLICADGRIPTIARALVDRGAVALVMPTAWVTSGRDPAALENVQADLLARVRAYENRVPFVAANKCGTELGMVAYCGKSQIVDASGDVLAIAGERAAQRVQASVALAPAPPPRVTPPAPPRAPAAGPAVRLALSFDPLPQDVAHRLELLDDAYALSPYDDASTLSPHDDSSTLSLERRLPFASVGDECVLDPAGLAAYRRSGYLLIRWITGLGAPWSERLARARALELRLYLTVFDRTLRRAFAVDPDGTIVAGTFGGYRLASFSFDPRAASSSLVAPRTDVLAGLDYVSEIADEPRR